MQADWRRQEAGLYAIGAVAAGCDQTMAEHMAAVLPHLIGALDAAEPLVRSGAWSRIRRLWVAAPCQLHGGADLV